MFVTKLSESGNALIFSTYLGASGGDQMRWIRVGPDEDVYVSGVTTSTNFPTLKPLQPSHGGGAQDGFLLKLRADGSGLVFSTYFGGSGDDRLINFSFDALGQIFATGLTNSPDFPTLNPIQASFAGGMFDGHVVQISANGKDLLFSTYLGGSGEDRGLDIEVDALGNIYLVGLTGSTDFPTLNARQRSNAGEFDGWVATFAPGLRVISSAGLTAPVAPASLASLIGSGLAQATASAGVRSPPVSLGGVSVRVRDFAGVERLAPLLHVSPTRIDFQVPADTAVGAAMFTAVNSPAAASLVVPVRSLAPGLFTLDDNRAAAYAVRVEGNGDQSVLPAGSPIVLDDRPVYLILFGTGIRNRSSLQSVHCTIGGISVPVEYAGPGGGIPGLDQVNVRLTPALKGNPDARLALTVDGEPANTVLVDVQ